MIVMREARAVIVGVLCLALVGAGCRAVGDDAVVDVGAGVAPAAPGSTDEIAEQIEATGIGVIASVADPMPATTIVVTRHQLDRMAEEAAAGSGLLGSALDAVAELPEDVPPLSAWISAWLHDQPTPRAELVAGWYPDDTDWHMAPQLLFSRAAILLFVADVAEDMDANAPPLDPELAFVPVDPPAPGTSDADAAGAVVVLAAAPQPAPMAQAGAVCETITTFFTNQITALFDALRISPGFLGGGVVGFIGGLLATLWNTAIDIASATAKGLVRNLTAPIVEAIAGAVAVAGIVSQISIYVTGWNIELTADPSETAFAVGAAPDNLGQFEVGPGTGYRPWQPDLEQCARATGVTLPRMLEPGSPVDWTVEERYDIIGAHPPTTPLILELSRDDRIPTSERPTFAYRTNREDSDDGPPGLGFVTVSARAPRAELQQVLTLARKLVDDTLNQIVSSALPVPAVADVARQKLHELIGPVLDELDALLRGAAEDSVFEVTGSAWVQVSYHGPPDPTEPPTEPVDPAARTCPYATTEQAISLSGVPGLNLAEVILPGDIREGMTVPWTSCAWTDDVQWFVSVVVHRGPHVPNMSASWRAEMEEAWESGLTRLQDVPGPWEHGFTGVARDPSAPLPGSQVYVGAGDIALEAHIIGKPGPDATQLAEYVWRKL
jgi:hypothetical protein